MSDDEEDFTHALVYWTKETSNKNHSIVKRVNIVVNKGDRLLEGDIYEVFFNKVKYPAKIIAIGTKEKCENIFQHKDLSEEVTDRPRKSLDLIL